MIFPWNNSIRFQKLTDIVCLFEGKTKNKKSEKPIERMNYGIYLSKNRTGNLDGRILYFIGKMGIGKQLQYCC
jgi:hypothetical protein